MVVPHKASKRLLQERAEEALENILTGNYSGMCDPVCVEFCRLIEELNYPTNGLASVSFLGEEPHYVAVLDGSVVDFSVARYLIVDPTIRQFSNMLDEYPEKVVFVDSNDCRWESWYQDFELIQDKRVDEFRAD